MIIRSHAGRLDVLQEAIVRTTGRFRPPEWAPPFETPIGSSMLDTDRTTCGLPSWSGPSSAAIRSAMS